MPQLPPHAVATLRLKNHLPPLPPLMNCGHALTATTSQAVTNRLADNGWQQPQQPLRTKPLPQSPTDTSRDPRSHGAAWVSYRSQATEPPQLSKAFRLAAAKFSRPPSRAAAELRHLPTTRLTHGAWSARAHTQPASDARRCGPPSRPGLATLLHAGQPRTGRQRGRESPGPVGAAHKEPRENKARVGLPMVAELVVEQDLPQCAAAAPRPRCRLHVVIVRAGRRRRGGSSIAGRAAGHDVWPDDAGLKLRTLPPGRRLRGRRAAPLHLRSSAAGI